MKKILLALLGLGTGQTLSSFSATINLENPCGSTENAQDCELNLEAITAIACEGLFNCSGSFSWPDDEKPEGVTDEPITNPLIVEDKVKDNCKDSHEIIAIPGQFEDDPTNQLPNIWPVPPHIPILEPFMNLMMGIEDANNGIFPCDIILNFAEKCPADKPTNQALCDRIKDVIREVFDTLEKEFPTCLESFECLPDFFADICPEHIECEGDMPIDSSSNVCLPTVGWPRALLINTNLLQHQLIEKEGEFKINTTGILTRGSMYSFYGNKHYFFGGEDLIFGENRKFEENVVYLADGEFKRSETRLPEYDTNKIYRGFARGAAAIFQGKVWICGVGFAPDTCYFFSGKKFDKSNAKLNIGHTEYPSLLSTNKFGLLISGGRTEVTYPEQDWVSHGRRLANAEAFEAYDGSEWKKIDVIDQTDLKMFLSHHLSIEINNKIYILGGNQGNKAHPSLKLTLPEGCNNVFKKNCNPILTSSVELNQFRQGRGFWKNNILTMVGNSLSSFGTFHEQLTLDDNEEMTVIKVSNSPGQEQSVSMFYDAAIFDRCLLYSKSSKREKSILRKSTIQSHPLEKIFEHSLTVFFETYDALDSVQESIVENLTPEKSGETLDELANMEEFKELDKEDVLTITKEVQVQEEILPDIRPLSKYLEYFDCVDHEEDEFCSHCETDCDCSFKKDKSDCDAFFFTVELEISAKTEAEQLQILKHFKDSINLTMFEDDEESCNACQIPTTESFPTDSPLTEAPTTESPETIPITIELLPTTSDQEIIDETTLPEIDTTILPEITSTSSPENNEEDDEVSILAIVLSSSYGALCLTAVTGSVFFVFKAKKKTVAIVLMISVIMLSILTALQITCYLKNQLDEASFLGTFILTVLFGVVSIPTLLF
ncbi:Oidioi.mRNA.OKI2018_I69.chr2.g4683.t1.cds [Oikopleura dioica]|uniref:Oidioi.mRNA.OKI2018_I69.chr2.g4683.t1.cds n=1 Tax=Oikopleura dioica TaxID=34765 RepID=A0ABN7T1H0_OIKDI|nr:Oidioi.mRNA.OKI2018_I69.chr2.g4683.t1.cds [Oikopleura dioica]